MIDFPPHPTQRLAVMCVGRQSIKYGLLQPGMSCDGEGRGRGVESPLMELDLVSV